MSFPVPETISQGAQKLGRPLDPQDACAQRKWEIMARPTKFEARNQQLNLKLTKREIEWLRARALRQCSRLVDYARAQVLAERPVRSLAKQGHLDPLFLSQLSRLGNNLNQIARSLHQLGLPPPETLTALLDEIRKLIRKGAADGS